MEVPITKNGYIYIYVANENTADVDVHFDDVEVTLIESPVVAGSDYYPFGLVMDGRSWSSEPYRFGYQGQFAEKDDETGWNAFEARMYDSRIGRWFIPDIARQFWSPFLSMSNNPINFVDPRGREGVPTVGKDGQTTYVLPDLEFSASGNSRSYSQGFWEFMAYLDDLVTCKSCEQEVNPYPVQFIIYGKNGGQMEYSSKPNPNAKTFVIDYDEVQEIMDLTDMMFPTTYKSTSGNLTEARNTGASIPPSANKVAVEQLTLEVHALVNKYNGEIVNTINYLRESKPDSVPIIATERHTRGPGMTWNEKDTTYSPAINVGDTIGWRKK